MFRRPMKSEKGMTMVEVIVASALLFMAFLIFYQAANLGNRISLTSEESRRAISEAVGDCYLGKGAVDPTVPAARLLLENGVTLTFSVKKTTGDSGRTIYSFAP